MPFSCKFFIYIFLLILTLRISAKTITQDVVEDSTLLKKKVSIHLKHKNLREALQFLSSSYQISFLYVEEQIPWSTIVNIDLHEKSLDTVLLDILANTRLRHFIFNDQIGLAEKEYTDSLETDSVISVSKFSLKSNTYKKDQYQKVVLKKIGNSSKIDKRYVYYVKRKNRNFTFGRLRPIKSETLLRDSLRMADSLSMPNGIKSSTLLLKNIRSDFFQQSIGIAFGVGNARWRLTHRDGSNTINDFNKYSKKNTYISCHIFYEFVFKESILFRSGFGLEQLTRKGEYVSQRINRFYPSRVIEEKKVYAYRYNYIYFPISIGYLYHWKNIFILPVLQFNISCPVATTAIIHPPYQIEYFSNINPFTTSSKQYYSKNNTPLSPIPVKLKNVLPSISLRAEASINLTSNFNFSFSPALTFYNTIYSKELYIKERPRIFTINFILKYKIK